MKITLTQKIDGIYGLKIDNVISPLDERTLQYILNNRYNDNCGIYKHNDRYIITLQNGTKFSINDKDDFLKKLTKAYEEISNSNDISSFEVI